MSLVVTSVVLLLYCTPCEEGISDSVIHLALAPLRPIWPCFGPSPGTVVQAAVRDRRSVQILSKILRNAGRCDPPAAAAAVVQHQQQPAGGVLQGGRHSGSGALRGAGPVARRSHLHTAVRQDAGAPLLRICRKLSNRLCLQHCHSVAYCPPPPRAREYSAATPFPAMSGAPLLLCEVRNSCAAVATRQCCPDCEPYAVQTLVCVCLMNQMVYA